VAQHGAELAAEGGQALRREGQVEGMVAFAHWQCIACGSIAEPYTSLYKMQQPTLVYA
jgi:hypothetical protein